MSGKNQGEADNVAGLPTEFRFDDSSVRTVVKDGEPWFVAKDVCEILDLDREPSADWTRTSAEKLMFVPLAGSSKCSPLASPVCTV